MLKTTFLQTCVGVSIVLLSLGFLFQSVQTATASPGHESMLQTGTASGTIGKYQMSGFGVDADPYLLVWDTETGKSKLYVYNAGALFLTSGQLPQNPLAN